MLLTRSLSAILRKSLGAVDHFFDSPLASGLGLLAVYLAGYGLFIPLLGYYGDDLSYAWLAYRSHEIQIFFEGNRPLFGAYFGLLTRWIGPAPWHWQILELVCRWASGLAFWTLLRLIWPRQKAAILTAAALLIVYPGFWLNSEAMTFHPFFLQLAVFLFSLAATVQSIRGSGHRLPWTIAALVGAFFGLWISEYLYTLELARLALVAWAAWVPEISWKKRLKRIFLEYLPYLGLFAGFIGLRLAGIGNFAGNYPLALLRQLRENPLTAVATLLTQIARDTWIFSIYSFAQALTFPGLGNRSIKTTLLFAGAILLMALLWFLWMSRLEKSTRAGSMVAAGLLALLLAGGPIWVAGLHPWGDASTSRFSLPFMAGACLLVVGLIGFLPLARLRAAGYALITAACLAYQLLLGFTFVQQVEIQKDFLWQLSARMPRLRPGTLLLTNPDMLIYNSDNSNSALVNWLYDSTGSGRRINYYVLQDIQQFRQISSEQDPDRHMIGDFRPQAVVTIHYHYPNCLRVLDPDLDPAHPYLPKPYRSAARLTDFSAIGPGVDPKDLPKLPAALYGSSQPRPDDWCSDYQKASRAAQEQDWENVAAVGAHAFSLGNSFIAPEELFVYIEGYARTGAWKRVSELDQSIIGKDKQYTAMFCRLKKRLLAATPDSPEREAALKPLRCPAEPGK